MQLFQMFSCFILFSHLVFSNYYETIYKSERRNYLPFDLAVDLKGQPANPQIASKGIYYLPQGSVYSIFGLVFATQESSSDQNAVKTEKYKLLELIWPNSVAERKMLEELKFEELQDPLKIEGSVAVITQVGISCYYHFLTEVLGRLAMLEQAGVKYDFVFVPFDDSDCLFWKQALSMWGLSEDKIIEPYKRTKHIQAEMLIVPSLIDRVVPDLNPNLSSYVSKETVQALRDKFLPQISEHMAIEKNFSKKIFISRKDAKIRKIENEDEVFAEFEKQGFVRYELSKMSFQEQICLFAYADQIVGIHGAGLANIIFSKPGTVLIEIFQARLDATYCYLSQLLSIKYTPIATQEHNPENIGGFFDTVITKEVLDKMLSKVQL